MSKIVSMEIENFMSVETAKIEFDESNIVSFCGYNNVGKSALTRSAEIMLYNAYSSEQAKFIKDGADYWKVSWSFDDGVTISRYKYIDGKSIWEMSKDGVELFTNKIGTSVASMQDIPEIIANYLGVVKDEYTGEQLNVRRNTDRLFLINTTGGDNYKILNSILKSDVLAEASKTLNEDKNKLQSKMQGLRTSCDTLKEESNNLDVAPKVVIDELKVTLSQVEGVNTKYRGISTVKETYNSYNDIKIYKELELVDISKLNLTKKIKDLKTAKDVIIPKELKDIKTDRLQSISYLKVLKEKSEQVIPKELNKIDITKLKSINTLRLLQKETEIVIQPELKGVDVSKIKDINRIKGIISEYSNIMATLNGLESKLNSVNAQLKEFEAQGYKICSNCGSAVI